MTQLITFLIVLLSLGGILFILYRKIPLLLELPATGETVKDAVLEVTKKVGVRQVQPKRVLGEAAKEARRLAIKTERKAALWTARLQHESQERKQEFQESYWDKLQKKGRKGKSKKEESL